MVLGLGFTQQLVLAILSLGALVYGAEKAVDKMEGIAAYLGIPDVLIAMSVISIGTSLPELASHIIASTGILTGSLSYEVASAAVLGGNIGSDVIQQTLVIGVVVIGVGGLQFKKSFLKKDYLPMIGTTLMTMILAWDGVLSRIDGLVLFGSFVTYMAYLYYSKHERLNHEATPSQNIKLDSLIGVTALSVVLVSAHIILDTTSLLIDKIGLGGSAIGVITIGLAAALPELFTAIEGLRQDAEGISLGTLIGSNITNPLLGIGLGSIMSTYWVPRPLVLWDLPMETVTAALLLAYLLFVSDRKLGWKGGVYLICLYVFYLVIRFGFFAVD
ncbi:MAG: sodium:calcium antiporter [Candidatus Nanohaloarchaeota archaeon QJJ-9]|nr:sodium:calcium antiporter [Candidatus Nanohaloarchaeota archaeon QJJ-9]